MATQLSIYQGACAVIGERSIQSLAENRESRRALDDVWLRGGVRTCLAAGLWNFAARSALWNYSPDITPAFGFQCAFDHPVDWIRWKKLCEDEFQNVALLEYVDEGVYTYCNLQQIYVTWISDDPGWGMNMGKWPDNFNRYVETYFGAKVARRLTNSDALEKKAYEELEIVEAKAKSTDAMEEPTQFMPPGTWSQARHGRRTNSSRGSLTQLIGGA